MAYKYDVAAIGAALVDTELRVEDSDLHLLALNKGMMTLSDTEGQNRNLELLREHIDHCERSSGGSAANSMIAMARLGAKTHLTCQVAKDIDGDFFLADLANAGVDCSQNNQSRPGTTGTCLVLITPDAERTMNTCLGISESLSVSNLDKQAIKQSQWLYLEGYLATSESGREAAHQASKQARLGDTKIALSLSDPGIVQYFGSELAYMAEAGLDLLFANREEILAFTGLDDIAACCEWLQQRDINFAITLGAEGAIVGWSGTITHVKAPTVRAIDTNGAGDAFAGAFLLGLQRGLSASEAANLACDTAAQVVSCMGPRLSESQASEIMGRWTGRLGAH